MPTLRHRIVPDNSVMIAAYFHEVIELDGSTRDLTRLAKPIVDAIRGMDVKAFAPEALTMEFFKIARRKAFPDQGSAEVTAETALGQCRDFLSLKITHVPHAKLVEDAWMLCSDHQIAPPDSLYLACAIQHNAELWIARPTRDNFAQYARKAWPNKVFVLTEDTFSP